MELKDVLGVLRRWGWQLVAAAVLAGLVGYLVGLAFPSFTAQSTALVGSGLTSSETDPGAIDASGRVARIYAAVAMSRPVLEEVIDELGLDESATQLGRRVSASTPQDPPVLTIEATDPDPDQASAIANAITARLESIAAQDESDGTQPFIRTQMDAVQVEIESVTAEVDALQERSDLTAEEEAQLTELVARLSELRSTFAALASAVSSASAREFRVLEEAAISADQRASALMRSALLAAFVGLAVATAVVFVMEHLDESLKRADDVKRVSGLPVLGQVGTAPARRRSKRATLTFLPHTAFGESLRKLRLGIEFVAPRQFRSLLVTSALAGEGKTTIACNLAVAFAQAGRTVVVVDANLRGPALHRQFGMENRHGLAELLASYRDPTIDLVQQTHLSGLGLLTAGTMTGERELVTPAALRMVLGRLKERAEIVIIDGPPVLSIADAAQFAKATDATLLVVASRSTKPGALLTARDALMRAKARILGAVLYGSSPDDQSVNAPDYLPDEARMAPPAVTKDQPQSG
jgi:non-specific protein-tyrosine kinase